MLPPSCPRDFPQPSARFSFQWQLFLNIFPLFLLNTRKLFLHFFLLSHLGPGQLDISKQLSSVPFIRQIVFLSFLYLFKFRKAIYFQLSAISFKYPAAISLQLFAITRLKFLDSFPLLFLKLVQLFLSSFPLLLLSTT